MKKTFIISAIFIFNICQIETKNKLCAQTNNVGIGTLTPAPSALLDVNGSPANNKGILIPRLSALERLAISSPANSLLVFDTDSACFYYWNAVTTSWKSLCNSGLTANTGSTGVTGISGLTGPTGAAGTIGIIGTTGAIGRTGSTGSTGSTGTIGFTGITGFTGTNGITGTTGIIGITGLTGSTGTSGTIGSTGSTGADLGTHWTITGNTGTVAGTNFIGTTDAQDLVFKANNTEWGRILTTGNVGIGTATPDASAKLDVSATNKGFLPPRVTLTSTTDALTITTPATALLVFNTAVAGVFPNNVTPGYYYNAGTSGSPSWVKFQTGTETLSSITTYTSSSIYAKPANLSYIIVEVWAGGGGGGATGGGTFGTNGTASSFTYNSGANSIMTDPGFGGIAGGDCGNIINGASGGAGGVASGGDVNIMGAAGQGGQTTQGGGYGQGGSGGGMSGGRAGWCDNLMTGATGGPASGGGGGSGIGGQGGAGGGGAGGYAKKKIANSSMAATETIIIGTGGIGGTPNGGNGGDGMVVIYEYIIQ
ncbi:MAG: hypothetical protein V4608_17355 [Bacteroidota bacterium]